VALNAGAQLGPYRITARIGAGGMGEVYQATDTNLGREVAIKVLPDAFAQDADRLARFEREAKVLASLSHPNIATVHGLEKRDGTIALVMELVEGPTLADRIAREPIPANEALPIAKQVAEALEAAHEQGIIHRDLKPANIKVRPDGAVKVLDFGLAKALDPVVEMTPALSQSPTVNSPALTHAGVILGTAAYMSPEQARGENVDKRADVWAFGCVLFEMLTGRRAFDGDTVSDTLAAVLRAEPEWHLLPSRLHPGLRALLERCLVKKPRDRYQGIADARVDIQHILANRGGSSTPPATDSAYLAPRRVVLWLAAVAALTAAVVGVAVWTLKPTVSPVSVRLAHALPPDQSFTQNRHPLVTVAPDGSSIVYVANNRLFRRPINGLDAQPVRGTEGEPSTPFFSPDGRWVGYWDARDEGLKKIGIEGGTAIALDRATIVRGASWGVDDTILYAKADGVWRISANGGQPERIIPIERGWVHGPQMLPDGHTVLFTQLQAQTGTSWEGAQIVVRDLVTGDQEVLLTGEDARYVPTGHLIYAIDTTLRAVPFDAMTHRVTGGPVPVVEGVRREVFVAGNTATANYGLSETGMLVYVDGSIERFPVVPRDLVLVDRQGVARPVTAERRDYWRPQFSPDGTRIAVEVFDGRDRQIWIVDIESGVWSQLTFEGSINDFPVWAPDGQSVIFNSYGEDGRGLYRKRVDGTADKEFLGVSGDTTSTDVSASGTLVFSLGVQTAERAIWTLPLAQGKASAILATPAQEHHAMFSPDGNWLAYASNASGAQEVYIRPYPIVQGTERRVSEGGGAGPVWAPDGSELYYRGAGSIMVAATPLGQGFVPGRPRPLFAAERFRFSGNAAAFDIHPDGKRFVMVTLGDPTPSAPDQINVVLNWFDELKRLVPTN
jgi:eukaryotic-like serine/threonine-protein kinase